MIVSEGAIAAGIRRITAYTGIKAFDYLKEKQGLINEAASILKINSDKGVRAKLFSLNDQVTDLNNTIKKLREENTNSLMNDLDSKVTAVGDKKVLALTLKDMNHEQEESLAHKLIDKYQDLVLFIAFDNGAKKDIMIARGNKLSSLKAGKLMKDVSKALDGRGGGKDDVAFGGTASLANFEKAKEVFMGLIK